MRRPPHSFDVHTWKTCTSHLQNYSTTSAAAHTHTHPRYFRKAMQTTFSQKILNLSLRSHIHKLNRDFVSCSFYSSVSTLLDTRRSKNAQVCHPRLDQYKLDLSISKSNHSFPTNPPVSMFQRLLCNAGVHASVVQVLLFVLCFSH